MSTMPLRAQLYWLAVMTLGVIATIYVCMRPEMPVNWSWTDLMAFITLAAVAGHWKVRLIPKGPLEQLGSMSLGSAITFAGMLHFGAALGTLIGVVASLSACVWGGSNRSIQPWHQLLFNISLTAISAISFDSVLNLIYKHPPGVVGFEGFPAVAAGSMAYWVINTGGVAFIIALCANGEAYTIWRKTFLWTAPGYISGASISLVSVAAFKGNTGAILFVALPIAYLTYQSYETYTRRAEEREKHIEELQEKKDQLSQLYVATIKSLATAIDAKDQYTHQHIVRVQKYSMAIAHEIGLSGPELQGLETGALLHDIGKLGVPEYVLLKPGRLSDEEFEKIKKHPEIGAAILDPVDFPWPVIPVVKSHHERWDGTGYPEGLKGEDIPLIARILAVADVYDAMTSSRSYRNAWPHETVIEGIKKDSGSHFDPKIVEAFLRIIDKTVEEMARNGEGPLTLKIKPATARGSRAEQAALHIQRASSEIWALYEVAQTTSCSLGLQETLEILARKLQAIFPGSACMFMLKNDETGLLKVRASVGVNQEFLQGSRTVTSESVSEDVCRRGITYLGDYDQDDLLLNGVQSTEWIALKTCMIVPIKYQGEQLGTINVYHPSEVAFSVQDKVLLESIAERAGMAVYSGQLYERTRSDAVTDPLTGLYNLRYLTQYVEEKCTMEIRSFERDILRPHTLSGFVMEPVPFKNGIDRRAGRRKDCFALLCLDLDSFKPINDNFGHQKGDQVLQELSTLFRSVVREDDIVSRYGGDEFIIVLQGAGPAEAQELANRLQLAVERYEPNLHHPRLGSLHLSVSIGYACYPLHGEDCTSLLSAADAHMYQHKAERKLGRLAEKTKSVDALREFEEEMQHIPENLQRSYLMEQKVPPGR